MKPVPTSLIRLFCSFALAVQPGRLLAGAALATLTVLAGMALLGLSGWFITATAIAGLQTSSALAFDVFAPSAAIRLLALGRTGSRYAERLVTHDATFAVLAQLRVRLFRGWTRPEAATALLKHPAQLLFRLTADIDALESLYLRLLVPAVCALGAALMAGLGLGLMHAGLGLAMLAWLLASGAGLAWLTARAARRPAVRRARGIERLRTCAIDLVAGQTDLLMAGQIDARRAALARLDARLAQADLALNRLDTAAGAAHGASGTLALVGVLLAVAALVESGRIDLPLAALAILLSLTAAEPFSALRRGALEAGRSALALKRLAPRLAPQAAARAAEASLDTPFALKLEHISVAHPGSPAVVLHQLSLAIASGERVALIGPSGAGKSTVLALAAREITPLSGALHSQAACLLTQRTELFQDSLRGNLLLSDPGASDDALWRALYAAGLGAAVAAMPNGLATLLGEGGSGLSGGQARRLALARLFLHPSGFWLLDEPTEALDAATARDVLRRLQQELGGRGLLVATHLRREAALADRLLCLRDGRIVADVRRGEAGFDAALLRLRPD